MLYRGVRSEELARFAGSLSHNMSGSSDNILLTAGDLADYSRRKAIHLNFPELAAFVLVVVWRASTPRALAPLRKACSRRHPDARASTLLPRQSSSTALCLPFGEGSNRSLVALLGNRKRTLAGSQSHRCLVGLLRAVQVHSEIRLGTKISYDNSKGHHDMTSRRFVCASVIW